MAQQAQPEPTMEEILASIRRIISEDAEEGENQPSEEPAEASAAPEPLAGEQDEEEEVLELTEMVEEERPVQEPEVVARQPEPIREPEPAPRAVLPERPRPKSVQEEEEVMLVDRERESGQEEGLLSSSSSSAMASAFSQLAERTRVASDPTVTLEDIVREMVRPMLKEWLDTNLPPLVERLVQEEIERATHQAGRRR